MSSKNDPDGGDRRPTPSWSLAARLTAWNAGSAFALVLAATGYLYWALAGSLDREDDQQLVDRVGVLRDLLANHAGDPAMARREVDEAGDARRHTPVYLRITDRNGRVLAEPAGMDALLPETAFPAPGRDPGEGADYRSAEGRAFRVLAAWVADRPYVIQAAMDRTQEAELLAEYRRNLWVVLGAALVLCAAVSYRIARRGVRPLQVITDTARRINPANLGERIHADGLPAELLALAETFNRMLDRLEQSFARLARFSADIAHELRTPVHNLRGEIEVALCRPRTTQEYLEVLGSSLEECGRLARLIDSLLFLARAEDPKTQTVKEEIDLGRELVTVCEFYEAAAGENGVRLAVAVPVRVQVHVNRPLLQRAVGNLVANAIAHTPPGGVITLTAAGDDTSAAVTVADTGCGIAAADLPHVFDRFYRADSVRSSTAGNVGLGLAIVKSIAELHSGAVQITSEVGRGTRITLTFPRNMTKL